VASLGAAESVAPRYSLVPPALKVPVTVFLRFEDIRDGIATGQLRGSLEVYTQDTAARITVEGRDVPLEFEPSTALAYSLESAPIWESEIRGFLRGNYLRDGGGALYTLTPYRPGHVPVVLIHGTASSPARWADLVNELNADPRIGPHIQFWLFAYNTGNPILYSAGLLHEALTRTVGELDPEGADPALRDMVLIGHSQGGLLAKLMVVDSGTRFWDNISETPLADLQVSEETRAVLRRSLFMTPLPFVDRVVFVATPHHGSSLAGLLIGRFRWLINWALSLPPNVLRMTGEVLAGSEDPRLRLQLQQGLPRSVDNMSPGHPAIRTLASLPVAPGVKVHSIIAIKGGGRSLDEAGDGVVSYRSAHLDEAGSELIVQSGHSVQGNPDAIEEIRRILIEHLGARSPASAQ
jgi:pimeloyl-ACP methyl ester carboxylesterase